jgi:hypothetical protein
MAFKIKNKQIRNAEKEIDVFLQLFPINMLEDIVKYTNIYKSQSKDGYKHRDFTLTEFVTFVGLLISESVLHWSGGVSKNWRKQSYGPYPAGTWSQYLPRDRYKALSKFLHFNDNSAEHNPEDRYYKIRLVLNTLNDTFSSAVEEGCNVSFDEGTWPTVSKYCPGKQFNPMKPHKWGQKLFMLCDASTGFCSRFELYQGRKDKKVQLSEDQKAGPTALLRNIQHLKGSKRVVYCDRYYTTVGLFLQLMDIGLYAVGTIKTNMKGFPDEIVMKKSRKIIRGTSKSMTAMTARGPILALSWMDCKPVHMISTAFMNQPCVISRQVKRNRENFDCLEPLKQYQKNMGGVDLNDFLRMAKYNVRASMNFRKWYKMCFTSAL